MRFVNRLNRAGFSLMEMLLVSAILPVIFFAIFANLSSGMRAWKTLNQPDAGEDGVLFVERAQNDFASAFVYTPIPFRGDSGAVSFAGSIEAPKELGADRGIGRIAYTYDPSRKFLVREESNLHEIFKDAPPRRKVVMSGITGFSVEYLARLSGESDAAWREEWRPDPPPARQVPAAVRVTVERLPAGRQGASGSLVKTFLVPSGN